MFLIPETSVKLFRRAEGAEGQPQQTYTICMNDVFAPRIEIKFEIERF